MIALPLAAQPFGIMDVIDILFVAILMYGIYRLMRQLGTLSVFYGALVIVVICLVLSQVSNMPVTERLFGSLGSVIPILIVVVFQEEIRRFLLTIGSGRNFRSLKKLFHSWKMKGERRISAKEISPFIMQIVLACEQMSKKYVGALIVIERNTTLTDIAKTGEALDARISSALIQNIFFKNSPLHDGAVIIRKDRILAAGCILPVSHDTDLPSSLGLRHRAALGVARNSGAAVVVVSEETGNISLVINGEIKTRIEIEELESTLTKIYEENN